MKFVERPTKIENVFICQRDNKLKLVDIEFDTSIKSIQYKLRRNLDWEEINSIEKLEKFISSLPANTDCNNSHINGNYRLLIPGGIDTHVHFNTPGYEYRDDFEHGSTAAAIGGTTMVFDMPCTSKPPVTSQVNFTNKENELKKRSLIDYSFWGGIRQNDFSLDRPPIADILDLNDSGVAGYKVYLISGMDTFRDINFEQLKAAAKIIAKTNRIIAVHAEDKYLVTTVTETAYKNQQTNWQAYCSARSIDAEVRAVQTVIKVAEETGCRFHVVHLSSGTALNIIADAKERGINITAETCPHYLHFTQQDFENERISNLLKTAPPVKLEEDKQALWEGLQNESLDFITTDHAGCDPELEKTSSNFWQVYGGIPGVEHRVPFMLSDGFISGRLSLGRTIELLSTKAAELFNVPFKGKLDKTFDADFFLFNPFESTKVMSDEMHSKGKYTPFDGYKLDGKIDEVYLRGKKIYNREMNFISEDFTHGKLIKL